MFKDIFSNSELSGSTLSLVDINWESLERMTRLSKQPCTPRKSWPSRRC
jgi:hypothetical protein